MNSLHYRLLTVTAALAITAATASAQLTMNAAVPFSFEAGQHNALPAGNYSVRKDGNVWRFTNTESLKTAMVMSSVRTSSKVNDEAQLVFECRGKHCALRNIRIGNGEQGFYWPAPKRSKSEQEDLARVIVVPLTRSNAD
jgi:hypothetical protein